MYTYKEQTFLSGLHAIALVIHGISSAFSFQKAAELPVLHANVTLAEYTYSGGHLHVVEETVGPTQQPVRWVAWNELITCVAHFVAIVIFCANRECCGIGPRTWESGRRWFSYAITAGLLQVALLLSLRPSPLFVVVFLLVTNAVTQILGGFMVDQEPTPSIRGAYLALSSLLFLAGAFAVGTASLRVTGLALESLVFSYGGLIAIYGIFYVSFAVAQMARQCDRSCRCIDNRERCCDTFNADAVFALLSVTSKVVLSWTLISIVSVAAQETSDFTSEVDWRAVQIFLLVASIMAIAGGLWVNARVFRGEETNAIKYKGVQTSELYF